MKKMLYPVSIWGGRTQMMSAMTLYQRVMEDKKSNYGWITSAQELVAVCNMPGFPNEYAKDIKMAILNCYVYLENPATDRHVQSNAELRAVYDCYYSMSDDVEEEFELKKRYLRAVIESVAYIGILALPFHPGRKYYEIRDNFVDSKFAEIVLKKEINFVELTKILKAEYKILIEALYRQGVFDGDNEEFHSEMKECWKGVLPLVKDL